MGPVPLFVGYARPWVRSEKSPDGGLRFLLVVNHLIDIIPLNMKNKLVRYVARSRVKAQDKLRDETLENAMRELLSKIEKRDDDTDRTLDLPVNGNGCGHV